MIKIEVTQEDINYGIPVSASYCPIAKACKRAFKRDCTVTSSGGVRVYNDTPKESMRMFDIPQEVRNFIRNFDRMMHVEPFTFELED